MVYEIIGNILNSKQDAIAHCITSDYSLGAGIALSIEKKYSIKEELKETGKYIYPDCIRIDRSGKVIYNLVNKNDRYSSATIDNLKECLIMLKNQLIDDEINNIAIPKIGSGKDRLDWEDVKSIIYEIFEEEEIHVFIYSLVE